MTTKQDERKARKDIDEMLHAITDPIIAHPGGWGSDIPEWLKKKIVVERMIEVLQANKTGREVTGTEAEACWYLSSASLTAPLDSDWTQIYLYVATRCVEEDGREVPEDIRTTDINNYQRDELRRLQRHIYKARVKARRIGGHHA